MLMRVNLDPAWSWTCPRCHTRNFAESSRFEPVDEDDLRQTLIGCGELEEWQETPPMESEDGNRVELLWMPDVVVCVCCGIEFETEGDE